MLFSRCGVLDITTNGKHFSATIYDTNSKFKVDNVDDLKYVGVLSGVRDCVVTDTSGMTTEIDKSVMGMGVKFDDGYSTLRRLYDITRNPHESVIRPSDCIENTMKNTTSKFKYDYTSSILSDPGMLYGPEKNITAKMAAITRLCNLPVSTVGLKLRIQGEEGEIDAVVHNPSGVTGFNHFNSSQVYFEAHSEMDVLMMMVAFLKHNGIWGEITANMDLFKFDYAGAFFDPRWMEVADETSFMAVRAQLISSYFKCKSIIKRATKQNNNKRRRHDEESSLLFPSIEMFESNSRDLCDEAMRGSSAVVGGGQGCPHSNSHVRLDESGKLSCLACFSTLFFVPKDITSNFIKCKNTAGAQQWINDRLEGGKATVAGVGANLKKLMLKLADITQAAHGPITLGSCGRRWNWPSKVSPILQAFIMYSLISALRKMREPRLPEMNVDALYSLMNPFGKMLLLFMHNSLVMASNNSELTTPPSPGGTAVGKWWDVYYAGPNLWSFQITKCEVEKNKTVADLACLETLQRLPLPGDGRAVVDERIIFKGFCRGENLAGSGELVSDITQSVNTMALVLENRDFFVDEKTNSVKSRPGVGDVMCSLEVTGYRPNRAQESRNSGRVSARIMRILDSREGARVWHSPKHRAILFERINNDTSRSTEAMERAITNHKILYYDIETNTIDFTSQSAVITSICCCLCTGGDISRGGERSVFGLAAPGTSVAELAGKIKAAYPGYKKNGEEEYVITDHAPDNINIYSNEFEMLMGFAEYVQEKRPHVISGWNSAAFDDPFVFTRIVKHLSFPDMCPMATIETAKSVLPDEGERMASREERLALAKTGLFNFEQFMDYKTGYMHRTVSADLMTGAASQVNAKFYEENKMSSSKMGSAGWFQNIIGGCCTAIRLDLMKVCAKAYKESLSEFNLNAVLAKVSNVGDRLKNVKDEVDLHYHLLGFLKLTSVEAQATVHVYCCKDAYLTAVVSTSINKEGEIFGLCLDSALIEPVVTANLVTPLCIGEGAVCRNMGSKRAERRGVGIRRHSIATETKGGMVSQSIVNHVPYQTIDMTSLYPMTMCQNNLCTSTFVSHRQVIDLRDRLVEIEIEKNPQRRLLNIIDECNIKVLESYRPNDIAVASWKNSNSNKSAPVTRLEKRIGNKFVNKGDEEEDDWCANAPPNMAITAAGLDYFPEVVCDINIQQAAKVNDDMHISPSSFEYLLQVLPLMIISQPHVGAQITAGECQTVEECLVALEEEFNEEKDAEVIKTHWTFAGTPQSDVSSSPVTKMVENIANRTGRNVEDTLRKCGRISGLLDRIYRRVNVFDSADDYGVRLWTSRLINVGMLVRTWNIKNTILEGIIPTMQIKYKADRVVMQQNAKKCAAAGDMKRAGLNKVGQLIMKLSMNSMYGCLALKAKSSKREFTTGTASSASNIANSAAAGGVGGGTRHSTTANQITETARCVFGNIGCALQQALPGTKQAYGDTDSVFCVHNIPGDGGVPFKREESERVVYLIDMVLKHKLSQIIPILVNCTTKGIRFVPRRDAGRGMMSIAHERLAVLGLLFAKKTYHMLHFNENSAAFEEMIAACKNNGKIGEHIDKFVTLTPRPGYADKFIVPHNPGLIFRAANTKGGKPLKDFLNAEGITDKESLREWFTSSPVWMELDATVVNNLYASKIVDAEKGQWIDAVTSRPLTDEWEIDAVTQANAAFTAYKKGAFVKKGISASTKLKGLQSLFSRTVPESMEPKEKYMKCVENHVKNFASHTTNPSMMITSARVNKLDPNGAQKRPNPLAMTINNHLNPSSSISLGEKFKTVISVSAWSLTADPEEIPAGYYNSGGVRWNPENMKGSIPCFSVKNLSVVPNVVSTAYDIMDADKKALGSMVKKNADILCTACAISGFSLRPGALSFNTGVIVTNDLAMACVRATTTTNKDKKLFVGGKQYIEYEDEEEENGQQVMDEETTTTASFFSEMKNDIKGSILSRLVTASCSACSTIAERQKVVEDAKNRTLNQYIVETMGLDKRVAEQMDALVSQVETVKEICDKKRQNGGTFKSQLDDMVAKVKVKFAPVLNEAAKLTRLHWLKCPVTIPDGGDKESEGGGVPLRVALEAMAGKYKCINTCDLACCQSLYFVLLCTLALKFENERRRREIPFEEATSLLADMVFEGDEDEAEAVMKKIRVARREETIKITFPKNYNSDTDCLVYLFEPSKVMNIASMNVESLKKIVSSLSESEVTGKVWNHTDRRFFGPLMDRETTAEEEARCCAERELPFVTGMYHTAAVEIAAACLSMKL
uniref:DNA-directed DNA polymerase n=1 Tax=Sesarmops intermedium nimavirus TaxID=2133796 RepID=A0A401IPN0_9VIRU|nr:MAG: wsv514-like protein [Sesarmops intermedium nimavirus]GBG35578.1 wsv514-like protein [Sesarmops intermedium nimavirus]